MEFRLNSGRGIQLIALHQWRTYEGLLEGLPHDKLNKRILDRLPEKAGKLTHCKKVIVLETKETPIKGHEHYPFGKTQSLPICTCVGMFKSFTMTNGAGGGHSELAICWFQEEFALPFDPEMIELLLNVAWNNEADDISFDDY